MRASTVRTAIRDACRRLEAGDLVAGASGNVSARLSGEQGLDFVAITPSQVPYAALTPEQIVIVDLDGAVVEGDLRPSSELPSHLAVYRARPDIGAVAHSHSVYATALAVAGRDVPVILDEQVMVLGGAVRVADYGAASTRELADNAVAALEERRAVLLRSHGALCAGRDLDQAVAVAEFLERAAKIYVIASAIGSPAVLPDDVVRQQIEAFRRAQRSD